MKFYENIEKNKDRIESCIQKFGHTSDHNFGWWTCAQITQDAKPVFVEWPDGSGLLTHKCQNEWHIWSDPLSIVSEMAPRIEEFCLVTLSDKSIKEVWCDDVADSIYPALEKEKSRRNRDEFSQFLFKGGVYQSLKHSRLKLNEIYYSLWWPVLDMEKYNPLLPGGRFKEIRNARSKFYREHQVAIVNAADAPKGDLKRIVDSWYKEVIKKQNKEDIFDLKYRLAVKMGFPGFTTARVMIVDGKAAGFNAGYEAVNRPGRFAGIIGLHNYSVKGLGTVLWLEDLDYIKTIGYKELDMQGSELDDLKTKTQFGATIERKTDTFSVTRAIKVIKPYAFGQVRGASEARTEPY